MENNDTWEWIPNEEFVWVPAKFLNKVNGELGYELVDKSTATIQEKLKSHIFSLDRNLLLKNINDLCKIKSKVKACLPYILFNLANRYYKGKIYTKVADSMLLAINPYQELDIYKKEVIEQYKRRDDLQPHIFSLAKRAITLLKIENRPQTIVIFGKSGSGKTETTRHLLNFLANENTIHEDLMSSIEILNAFGNAKTILNDNSTRHAKFIKIYFKERKIISYEVTDYLLDRQRITIQNRGERNYHIFYYLCRGIKSKDKKKLHLKDIDQYTYLNKSGCKSVGSIDDKRMFIRVESSLIKFFGEEGKNSILEILSAILLFGNIETEGVVKKISELIKIDIKKLMNALNGNKCNICAELLYKSLFKYIVTHINKKWGEQKGNFIGVLDMFGFEILDQNSFEQLCINYANERLRQYFIANYFKQEKNIYMSEGLNQPLPPFKNNEDIINLIDNKKGSLFFFINQQMELNDRSDEKLLDIMNNQHHLGNERYIRDPKNPKAFAVKHSSGLVSYRITDFIEKNDNEVPKTIIEIFKTSTHPILQQIFNSPPEFIRSVAMQYKSEMTNLINEMNKGDGNYIKCILPNKNKLPFYFDHKLVHKQIKENLVMEAMEMNNVGFNKKILIKDFLKEYKIIGNKENVKEILSEIKGCTEDLYTIGNSVIFLKDQAFQLLQEEWGKAAKVKAMKISRGKL